MATILLRSDFVKTFALVSASINMRRYRQGRSVLGLVAVSIYLSYFLLLGIHTTGITNYLLRLRKASSRRSHTRVKPRVTKIWPLAYRFQLDRPCVCRCPGKCTISWCLGICRSSWYIFFKKSFGYQQLQKNHYSDVIMGATASRITSVWIVYFTICSDAAQRKHRSSVSLAFVWGIRRWPVNSPHKGSVTRKMFPFDDVIMTNIFCRLHCIIQNVRWYLARSCGSSEVQTVIT